MLSDLHPFQVLAPECTFFMCCILICTCFRCCHPICTCFRRWHLNAHVSCDEFWFEPVSGPGTCFMWCTLICTCFRCWSRCWYLICTCFSVWHHDCTCFRPWHLIAPVPCDVFLFASVSGPGTWMHLFRVLTPDLHLFRRLAPECTCFTCACTWFAPGYFINFTCREKTSPVEKKVNL